MYKNINMLEFKRNCPNCNNIIIYKSKESLYMCNYKNTICKRCHNNKKLKNKCEILLNESLETYYWLGFIMADGHFNTNLYNVSISLHNKDKDHLVKLQNYLHVENITDYSKINQVGINFGNKLIISNLIDRFAIKNDKTKNPPNLSTIIGKNLIAFNIGFIDGDGCISNQSNRSDIRITIRCHKSWIDNLQYMFKRGYIANDNSCVLCIGKKSEIKEYKQFILNNNIPFLSRKWDKIII